MQWQYILSMGALGGLGAVIRVLGSKWIEWKFAAWLEAATGVGFGGHLGTMVINLLGCGLVGVCTVVVPAGPWRVVVIGGLLGGLTTFGSFAYLLADNLGKGEWGTTAVHLLLHLVGGCVLAWAGREAALVLSASAG